MQAAHKFDTFSLPAHHEEFLKGKIFPKEKTSLPVQEFLGGERAEAIVAQKLGKNKDQIQQKDIAAYISVCTDPHSKFDIVNRLQHAHIRALTKIRTANTLWSDSLMNSLVEANKKIDISDYIISELEPFILALMNIKNITSTTSLESLKSILQSRNKALHDLKLRFLDTFASSESSIPMDMQNLFVSQLKKAHERIYKNHPIHGFLGTLLYEINRNPLYFHQPSTWFGFGANIDADFLSKIPVENKENRFWFAKVTAQGVEKDMYFRQNTLLFSVFDKALKAIDGTDYFANNKRHRVILADNAGAFGYYADSFYGAEIEGVSSDNPQGTHMIETKDEYFWVVSHSYGHTSFNNSPCISGGLNSSYFYMCFNYSEFKESPIKTVISRSWWNSVFSNSAKHSIVYPGTKLSPRELHDGSFDYANIMSGFHETIVYNSLKNSLLIQANPSENIGYKLYVPMNKDPSKQNTTLENSFVTGQNTLSEMTALDGLQKTSFLYSGWNCSISWISGKFSLWYRAWFWANVSDLACEEAYVWLWSFCGAGTQISWNTFKKAKVTNAVGMEAIISDNPFAEFERIDKLELRKNISTLLEAKIKSLVSAIQSDVVARNDAIDIAIRSTLPAIQNTGILKERDYLLLKTRLNYLLSSSFDKSEKIQALEKELMAEIEMGRSATIGSLNKQISLLEWDSTFRALVSDTYGTIELLWQFWPKERLNDISNWTSIRPDGDLGVSEKIAQFTIDKINEAIKNVPRNPFFQSKTIVLAALMKYYIQLETEPKDSMNGVSLHNAKFVKIDDVFKKETLPRLKWESGPRPKPSLFMPFG